MKLVTFDDSPTSTKEGITMVRCFDCCKLIKSWRPTTKRDWLFEETWRCKVTGERVEQYYFKQKERDCKHYEKRPKLVLNTMKYTQLVNFEDDEFEVATATTIEEAKQFLAVGFDYVTEKNGICSSEDLKGLVVKR